jgi:hypothetical protein
MLATICPASAGLVTVDFSGTIIQSYTANNYSQPLSSVPVGASFTGTAYYSTDDVSPKICYPPYDCQSRYDYPIPFFVDVNGSTITSSPSNLASNFYTNLLVQDADISSASNDIILWYSQIDSTPVPVSGPLQGEEYQGPGIFSVYLLGSSSILSNTQEPMIFPSFGAWDLREVQFTAYSPDRYLSEGFTGYITGYTITVSPEPSTLYLFAFSAGLLWLAKQKQVAVRT